jgi:uncharacterized protein (DUF58 family)
MPRASKLRLLALLLVGVLFCLCACGGRGAESAFSVESASCAPGEEVTVRVTVQNNPGLTGIKLRLSYGDAQSLVPHSFSAWQVGGMVASNVNDPAFSPNPADPYVTLVWAGTAAVSENGTVFSLTFRVAEDAPPKDYPLTLTVTECQKDGGRVEMQATSGTLTVR